MPASRAQSVQHALQLFASQPACVLWSSLCAAADGALPVQISPQSSGRIDMQYRRVQCVPPSAMNVVVDNNNGPSGWLRLYVTVRPFSASLRLGWQLVSSSYRLAVQPKPLGCFDSRAVSLPGLALPSLLTCAGCVQSAGGVGAVANVQVRTSGTTDWNTLNNQFGSVFEMPNAPSYPLDLNIVGSDGESVRHCCCCCCCCCCCLACQQLTLLASLQAQLVQQRALSPTAAT